MQKISRIRISLLTQPRLEGKAPGTEEQRWGCAHRAGARSFLWLLPRRLSHKPGRQLPRRTRAGAGQGPLPFPPPLADLPLGSPPQIRTWSLTDGLRRVSLGWGGVCVWKEGSRCDQEGSSAGRLYLLGVSTAHPSRPSPRESGPLPPGSGQPWASRSPAGLLRAITWFLHGASPSDWRASVLGEEGP